MASIQFNSDMSVHSNDGVAISKSINTPGEVLPDNQRGNVAIRTTNTPGVTRFQQNGRATVTTPANQSVQLQQPTGRVAIAGTSVTPEVLETLKVTSPELFEDEGVKQAREAAEQADAKAAEDEQAALNTHPDQFVEESHAQFTNVVPAQLQTELLVQMHRDGAPSKDTLNRVADSLGVTVDEAITRLNAMSAGVQAQLSVLAKARGVSPEQFANWARDNRRGESLRAMQGHVQSRSLLSWDPLINEFKARGQK